MTKSILSGLLATGSYDDWNVDIDELTKGSELLFGVTLTHSMIKLQFSIADLSIINEMIDFLYNLNVSHFKIDGCLGGSLNLTFDEGRLYIRQMSKGKLGETELFEVRFIEDERKNLITALKDALEDL